MIGALSLNSQTIQYALPTQWPGLVSVLTLPRSDYQAVWWALFALTLTGSLAFPMALFWCLRWARLRYCSIIPKLRRALKENQLQMHYQPIVNMYTGEWVGVESLIRWPKSSLSPADFIPAAEVAGMSGEVTRWVVRQVAEDYSRYLWACKGLYITINLCAQNVEDETFAQDVLEILQVYQIPAHLITFEITETSLLNRDRAKLQLNRLREQGHRIAVDDFGTGYSSLSYLSELPVDILKLDRSFLTLEKMLAGDGLWRHIADIASSLRLTVVAEGVEHPEQADLLMRESVQFAQGWLYAKALPAQVLARQFFRMRKDNFGQVSRSHIDNILS
jgi:sensor c-di-GMP phosphodiesterase-like protein